MSNCIIDYNPNLARTGAIKKLIDGLFDDFEGRFEGQSERSTTAAKLKTLATIYSQLASGVYPKYWSTAFTDKLEGYNESIYDDPYKYVLADSLDCYDDSVQENDYVGRMLWNLTEEEIGQVNKVWDESQVDRKFYKRASEHDVINKLKLQARQILLGEEKKGAINHLLGSSQWAKAETAFCHHFLSDEAPSVIFIAEKDSLDLVYGNLRQTKSVEATNFQSFIRALGLSPTVRFKVLQEDDGTLVLRVGQEHKGSMRFGCLRGMIDATRTKPLMPVEVELTASSFAVNTVVTQMTREDGSKVSEEETFIPVVRTVCQALRSAGFEFVADDFKERTSTATPLVELIQSLSSLVQVVIRHNERGYDYTDLAA